MGRATLFLWLVLLHLALSGPVSLYFTVRYSKFYFTPHFSIITSPCAEYIDDTWRIATISGCLYNYEETDGIPSDFGITLGCQRGGGQTVTITGSFSKGSANPKVEFYQADQPWQFKECSSVTMLSSTKV